MWFESKLKIAGNEIYDCPYTGISIGWIWDDRESPARENQIVDNQIHHVMQVLSDGGGVYTLGRQPNSVIANNQIHDVPLNAGRAESNGIFLDQGSTGFHVDSNEFSPNRKITVEVPSGRNQRCARKSLGARERGDRIGAVQSYAEREDHRIGR